MPLVAAGVCVGSDKVPLIYYVHPVHSCARVCARRDALRGCVRAILVARRVCDRENAHRAERSLT